EPPFGNPPFVSTPPSRNKRNPENGAICHRAAVTRIDRRNVLPLSARAINIPMYDPASDTVHRGSLDYGEQRSTMNLISTLRGSLMENYFPAGWDLAKIDKLAAISGKDLTARKAWWHAEFEPL